MLDKILGILDSTYINRGGYEFVNTPGLDTTYLSGGRRTIGSIIVNMPYNKDNPTTLDWGERWLKKFDFSKVGDVPDIGRKLNVR